MIIEAKLKKGLNGRHCRRGRAQQGMDDRSDAGQMTLSRDEATKVGALLDLPKRPSPGCRSCRTRRAAHHCANRSAHLPLYELISVYGTSIKELIHEEFGDGIMSAIDFSMDIQREPDPKGDRVKIVLNGKFLPYKTY